MPQIYTRQGRVTHIEQCIPCVQQAQRYVGVPGLYGVKGLRGVGLGIADPASANCVAKGGTSVTTTDAAGNAVGLCQFPNGKTVNEWALFRGEVSAPSTYDIKRDLLSATIAFGLPALYHYKAPKKYKRSKFGEAVAVVGLYFLTSFIYGKATAS